VLFNSGAFAVFFPVVTAGYFALGPRGRQVWLLIASAFFYAWFIPRYLVILYGLILIDYAAGFLIAQASGRARRAYLVLSLAANLTVLGLFKYLGFLTRSLADLSAALGLHVSLPILELALPIGLSFHTFQSMAYTIEVYRGTVPVERDFVRYALYVTFYPQLVAGPIERPQGLLAQLRASPPSSLTDVTGGLRLMAWGLLKKIAVADRVAVLVDKVYAAPTSYSGLPLIVATLLFSIQIYCDFSGYSDIAIGAARVMGIRLVKNFDAPYAARSMVAFWRRWHISLSTWFRDYVFLPLAAARWPTAVAVMGTFLLSGLWHGANWTFVLWGGLHGLAVMASRWLMPDEPQGRLRAALQVTVTFACVSFLWIFFRAASLADAWWVVSHLFVFDAGASSSLAELWRSLARPGFFKLHLPCALAVFAVVHAVERRARGWRLEEWLAALRPRWRLCVDYAVVLAILLLGEFHATEFIYFQF
jgi:D-alanyl-lipoteichoic acid acyltransferase DltB (MBOAT superfamily)